MQIPYLPSLPSLWNQTAVTSNLAPIIYSLPSDLTLVQLLYLSESQFPYLQDGAMLGESNDTNNMLKNVWHRVGNKKQN